MAAPPDAQEEDQGVSAPEPEAVRFMSSSRGRCGSAQSAVQIRSCCAPYLRACASDPPPSRNQDPMALTTFFWLVAPGNHSGKRQAAVLKHGPGSHETFSLRPVPRSATMRALKAVRPTKSTQVLPTTASPRKTSIQLQKFSRIILQGHQHTCCTHVAVAE